MAGANVVRDFHIENTHIKIADNYCRKTAGEVEQLLKRIAKQAQCHYIATAAIENYEEIKNKKTEMKT